MLLEFHVPSGPLATTVALMVYHRDYRPVHAMERFLPDGGIELVVDLGDEPKHIYDESTGRPLRSYREAWVSGMRTRPITISAGGGQAMLVVTFHPHAASTVFRVPMDELRDRVVSAGAVMGCTIDRFRERIGECTDPGTIFEHAERWLLECAAGQDRRADIVQRAATVVRTRPTMATIDGIVRSLGVSHRTLVTLFREHVGVTPKQYQRVHRFQEVVRKVEGGHSVRWSEVALECGFYDQAHMTNEFRRFSGFTPTQYLEARGDVLNYVPVA